MDCNIHTLLTGISFLLLIDNITGRDAGIQSSNTTHCPFNFSHLDFLYNVETKNMTELLIRWPCELRVYWSKLQDLVLFEHFLLSYGDAALIIIGLILNSAAFLILSSYPMNGCSLSIYLRALAASDNLALLCNCAVGIARSHSDAFNHLYLDNEWICIANNIAFILFFYTSTWLVVMVTLERVVVIRWPLFNKMASSAPFVVLALFATCLVVALTRLQLSGLEQDNVYGYEPCRCQEQGFTESLYFYFAFSAWLPLLLISTGNVSILVLLWKSNCNRIKLSANVIQKRPGMTRMLLLLSAAYVFLILPIGTVSSMELYWDAVLYRDPEGHQQLYIQWKKEKMLLKQIRGICLFIYHFNFVINFFLYCISGENFRDTASECLSRWLPSVTFRATRIKMMKRINTRMSLARKGMRNSPSTTTLSSNLSLNLSNIAHSAAPHEDLE